MTLDRMWLLGTARAEREALGRTIQYMPPDHWEAESPVEGWRVADVVAHLAATEVAAAAIVAGEAASEPEEFEKSLPAGELPTSEAFSAWGVARRAESSVVSVALEWGRAADLLLTRVSGTAPEEWDDRRVAWFGEELRLGYFVQSRVAQWWIHGENLRAGGGLPPRLEHPPMYCVNDLAVRLIPYALSLEEQSFPEASVEVKLEAVGGGSWHQGLAPGFEPGDRKPDAYVAGRAHSFALVASGHADPDLHLYEGELNVGGDLEIARAVLRTLRAYV